MEGLFSCPDYDGVRIGIEYKPDTNDLFFYFSIANFKDIYQISGAYFMKKYYPEYKEENPEKGFDFVISRKHDFLLDVPSFKNPTPEQEQQKIAIKQKNKDLVNQVGTSLGLFRVNFLASPFQQVFDQVKEGKQPTKFSFTTRAGDRVWYVPYDESVTFFFGLSFQDQVDKSIAKLMLDEFIESKRHVKNPPSISRTYEDQKFSYPQIILDSFPQIISLKETFTNGLISFTFFKNSHLKENTDEIGQFLATFRQFIHYHVSASKSYLHCRLMKNIENNFRALQFTLFEQEEEKNFRTMRDEVLNIKSQQEEEKRTILKKN